MMIAHVGVVRGVLWGWDRVTTIVRKHHSSWFYLMFHINKKFYVELITIVTHRIP